MNIWRLIAHHEEGPRAIEIMKESSRIAIGWSKIGDLRSFAPKDASVIAEKIAQSYPESDNAHLGGPSLWNLYARMNEGDFVIVNANGKRQCVFQVNGPYFFDDQNRILGYAHQRMASLTSIDPEAVWNNTGSSVEKGQNIRWTLAACLTSKTASKAILEEGARFSVLSTSVERNPLARQRCIEIHGVNCAACGFNFEEVYGEIGRGYIHVHHRVDLSTKTDVHTVDPEQDLVPLCPNCHAMVHTKKPAMTVENLKRILGTRKNA